MKMGGSGESRMRISLPFWTTKVPSSRHDDVLLDQLGEIKENALVDNVTKSVLRRRVSHHFDRLGDGKGPMALRDIIRSLVPPILTDFLRGGRALPSWQAAAAASMGYEDEALNSFKVKRAAQHKADGSLLATSMLHLTALVMGKADITVTDLGGSTGDLGRDFLNAFPEATYTVVENPTMVRMMRGHGSVGFSETVPAACDIFFTSGTLQYLEDPVSIINQGFASAGFAAILARNSFCDVELFRVQRSKLFDNGSGDIPDGYKNVSLSYPHRTLKESTVREIAERHGLRCIARIEDRSGIIPYRGMVYGQQLVFLRMHRR